MPLQSNKVLLYFEEKVVVMGRWFESRRVKYIVVFTCGPFLIRSSFMEDSRCAGLYSFSTLTFTVVVYVSMARCVKRDSLNLTDLIIHCLSLDMCARRVSYLPPYP